MRSEQQHIDDFVRNKAEEFHPNPQDMQANWKQMQSMLAVPTPKFRISKTKKLIRIVGGVVAVTVITITAIQLNSKKNTIASRKTETKTTTVATKPAADNKKPSIAKVENKNTANTSVSIKKAVPNPTIKEPLAKTNINPNKKVPTTAIALAPDTKEEKKPDPLLLLEQFYTQMKKTPEEFIIRADRDTILQAREGTKLKIPSHSFDKKTGTIRIILTEFYADEDMITEKLSTTSNGQQLVTGGMLNIRAEADGQPVKIAPDKAIKVEMPTQDYDEKMQLFTGDVVARKEKVLAYNYENDSRLETSIQNSSEMIDWVPAGQQQLWSGMSAPPIFKVPDIAGEPYKVRYGKKKITATFLISRDLEFSNKEVKEKLKRYSLFYDKIKVRRLIFGPNFLRFNKEEVPVIKGDSIVMKFESALRLKLVSKEDSLRFRELLYKDSSARANRKKYLTNYTFEVKSLGWINCDRYWNNPGPRVEFTINLGEGIEAGNFITQLVFDKYRSMMPGYFSGTKIQFPNVPPGESVHLIAVGVIDGKVVSCIKHMNITKEEVHNLPLEETTSDQFRKEVKEIVKKVTR